MNLPEGTKVIVTDCFSGHQFKIGQVCIRTYGEYEEVDSLGFKLENDSLGVGIWYMHEEEYRILHDEEANRLYEVYKKAEKEYLEYISNE